MQSLLSLAFVVFAAAAVAAQSADECGPTPGQRPVRPNECCDVTGFKPTTMQTAVDKCKQKYNFPKPPRPSGPPTGPPPTPSAEMKLAHACSTECSYSEEGLLTAAKTLDKAAITKYFTSDASLAPVVAAAIDKCFASYPAEVDTSLECKSGAGEFHRCLNKEVFLNCPTARWTASTECADLKAKLVKCPMMPFKMGGGPRRPN